MLKEMTKVRGSFFLQPKCLAWAWMILFQIVVNLKESLQCLCRVVQCQGYFSVRKSPWKFWNSTSTSKLWRHFLCLLCHDILPIVDKHSILLFFLRESSLSLHSCKYTTSTIRHVRKWSAFFDDTLHRSSSWCWVSNRTSIFHVFQFLWSQQSLKAKNWRHLYFGK